MVNGSSESDLRHGRRVLKGIGNVVNGGSERVDERQRSAVKYRLPTRACSTPAALPASRNSVTPTEPTVSSRATSANATSAIQIAANCAARRQWCASAAAGRKASEEARLQRRVRKLESDYQREEHSAGVMKDAPFGPCQRRTAGPPPRCGTGLPSRIYNASPAAVRRPPPLPGPPCTVATTQP